MADTPSRLSDGNILYNGKYISMEEYRSMISARNLYNPYNEYENTNTFSKNAESNVANSIQTVLNVIPQYNRVSTSANLVFNALDAFGSEQSALARIGLVMLGKQIAYNSASNLATRWLPSIDLSQALKGNMKGIFKRNVDNTITVKDSADKTGLEKIGGFANKYLGIETYDVFGNANPFTKNPTPGDYIKNTGQAQLTHFFSAVNLNTFKPINPERDDQYTTIIREHSEEVGVPLLSGYDTVIANNRKWFNFMDYRQNPYFRRALTIDPTSAIDRANVNMQFSYSLDTGETQEYAPYIGFIDENFGKTVKTSDRRGDIENQVGPRSTFDVDNGDNNLVWGRDGLSYEATTYLSPLRGEDDAMNLHPDSQIFGETNTRTGLLEYTRNLLNASEGNFVDITRKAFKDGDNIVGFNGSPLWRGNNTTYSQRSGNANKTGVRQHTILDPYDNFTKSIRFKGNYVYKGPTESVVNKTVLPRIHPTMKNGVLDNKNLMFSIENLAVGTIRRDSYGVIDDEYATAIPLSEVGQFGGRQMWFPPYNVQINEVASAKYESTVMVGRNEPMYNYMNSERTAVVSFTLLIDYPEQLRNAYLRGEDKNKVIADFFAFGGESLPDAAMIDIWEKQIRDLENTIPEIEGPTDQAEPPDVKVKPIAIYFPNDVPVEAEVDTVISSMYNIQNYEIIEGLLSGKDGSDGNGFGLNKDVYFIKGLSGNSIGTKYVLLPSATTTNQYTEVATVNENGTISTLNKYLFDVFNNEENVKYYKIVISAEASKLYLGPAEAEYNKALGNRRARAAEKLIRSRLAVMFPELDVDEIQIDVLDSTGSEGNSAAGAEAVNMHEKSVKEERSATIEIARKDKSVEKKEQDNNQKQKDDLAQIQKQIQALQLKIKTAKQLEVVNDNILNERDKAVLDSFESVSGNKYYPVFHSQTPEDFHRRLTFLQQCTRQGAAKRYYMDKDAYGTLRAKNSVFGKQPICVLRIGDFLHTKVVIETVTIDYNDTTWDMNPEGFGMQPMIANVTLQMKVIGGQSLKGPIDALQNAVTFNYYANSNFTDKGMYSRPAEEADKQASYREGIEIKKSAELTAAYEQTTQYQLREGDQ